MPDKAAVFAEVARVLRPGGRLVVSDIILDSPLPSSVAHDVLSYVGCISGAVLRRDYFGLLEKAGLAPVEVLRDFDALNALVSSGSEEVEAFRKRTGVDPRELSGKVRSLTFRAIKPSS